MHPIQMLLLLMYIMELLLTCSPHSSSHWQSFILTAVFSKTPEPTAATSFSGSSCRVLIRSAEMTGLVIIIVDERWRDQQMILRHYVSVLTI
ncbi:hypothetical protein BJ138DRAFT_1152112 [Hygrophoropsis aurantiaca]|uniref:Uncharacterized protein n=1 Tax=Hygrophoropsis aurantiaca TaxID=72124 RepID=A0ACB8AC39_9AGAM|nr:hypothetical protein BJ138DRAFT_1152112 [Hygrophoropsis aurantiaca]